MIPRVGGGMDKKKTLKKHKFQNSEFLNFMQKKTKMSGGSLIFYVIRNFMLKIIISVILPYKLWVWKCFILYHYFNKKK